TAMVERAQKMMLRLCRKDTPVPADREQALLQALLTAFPDRVARRRRAREPEVLLSGGGAATLSPASVVRDAELLVAVEAEEQSFDPSARSGLRAVGREARGAAAGVVIKTASAIE